MCLPYAPAGVGCPADANGDLELIYKTSLPPARPLFRWRSRTLAQRICSTSVLVHTPAGSPREGSEHSATIMPRLLFYLFYTSCVLAAAGSVRSQSVPSIESIGNDVIVSAPVGAVRFVAAQGVVIQR